jgi:hypothetical protein
VQDLETPEDIQVSPVFKEGGLKPMHSAVAAWLTAAPSGAQDVAGYRSLRDLVLSRLRLFEATFRSLGDDSPGDEGAAAADPSTSSARSARRRDLNADAAAQEAHLALAKEEAARAAALSDLKRTNPSLKVHM